ncbi:MAG: type II toxin-antitoxin system HicB family antitoxin [Lachnospiraceae bacterium]
MAKYIYPAVFTLEEGKYAICFPDIEGCYTCGDDLAEGMEMAQDALALTLTDLEDSQQEIPESSDVSKLEVEKGSFATYISCDTTVYRRLMKNTAVKKTLSIPLWLNDVATAAGLNFSQVLQDALKQKLNISE